ncbi:MAG TPA: hypothetical protein PLL53_08830 [Saprospiraceae bacterium]|jgi:hypothetical protein|nr:hypothetical protein [Saprospiraceae bacterium]
MKRGFVFSLLSTFSDEEAAAFDLFLQSPYYTRGANQDKSRVLLKEIIRGLKESPEQNTLYERVFPETPFVQGKLDKLMSELSAYARQFLIVRQNERKVDSFDDAMDWAFILRRRGLWARYAAGLEKAEKILNDSPIESLDWYYDRFRLAYERYDMASQENKLKGDLQILPAMSSLDTYYLACRVEMVNLLLLQQKVTRVETPRSSRIPYFSLISEEALQENVLLRVALKINEQLIQDKPSAIVFHEIHALIQCNENKIAPQVLQNFYAYLRNLCAFLIQMEDDSFLSVLHDIQKDNIAKGYILLDGKLSPSAYLSIAKTAIKVGNTGWALSFVEDYKDLLFDEDEKEAYYRLNKAECLFSMGQFEEALDVLPAIFSDALYLTHCRRLELKLLYKLNSDLLSYKVDAYKMFLSRASKKLLSDMRREVEGNFINLLVQLINCPPGNKAKAAKIIQRIHEKRVVADKEWLMAQAEDIMAY